jgi:hypothetical protein
MRIKINILHLMILMSFNQIVPMYGGFAQGGCAAVDATDYLRPDDFEAFVVEQFTFSGVNDYQQFYEIIRGIYNRRLNYARQLGLTRFPLKREVIEWIDKIVSERQPKSAAIKLTPQELEPVDLVCADAKIPYFVNRSTLSRMQERGDELHPEVRCKFTALDMAKSWEYWVNKSKITLQQWLDKLKEGDSLTLEDFNLAGLADLIASQANDESDEDAELDQAIALSLQQPDAVGYRRVADDDPSDTDIDYIINIIPDLN